MSIYEGASKSISSYLQGETYFFIPEYQRQYSWSERNVKELIKDINSGLQSQKIASEEDREQSSSTYLGCVIDWNRAVDENDYVSEHGVQKYISKVRELIDGQQRTSTLALLCSRLYWKIEDLVYDLQFENDSERKLAEEINKEYQEGSLLPCFTRKDANTDTLLPFIIREGEDKWSLKNKMYKSPLSLYIHKTICLIDENEKHAEEDSFHFSIKHAPDSDDSQLGAAIVACDQGIEEVIEELIDVEILGNFFRSKELFPGLNSKYNKVDLVEYTNKNSSRALHIKKLVSLCAFVKYLQNYCFLTIISSPSMEKSLDIFQSINSTGEQLTALDLIKPRIAKLYRDDGALFKESEAFKIFSEVDDWLSRGNKWYKSSTRVKNFFEIAKHLFNVNVGANNLAAQRKIITEGLSNCINASKLINGNRFSKMKPSEVASEFCEILKSLKCYLDNFSLNKDFNTSFENEIVYLDKGRHHTFDTKVAFNFFYLLESHEIYHSFLVNVYHDYRVSESDKSIGLKDLYFRSVNFATLVFTKFRVLANKYPDAFWKSVYREAPLYCKKIDEGYLESLYEDFHEKLKASTRCDLDDYKALRKEVIKNVKYSSSTSLIKFFVFYSSTNTLPDTGKDVGLVRKSAKGNDLLKPSNWISQSFSSVEHIAPQDLLNKHISPWDEKLCDASDTINSIGNLTLIEKGVNSSIKCDAKTKAVAYSKLLDDKFKVENDYITEYCSSLVDRSERVHHLKSISERLCKWILFQNENKEFAWDKEFIEKRSKRLAGVFLNNIDELLYVSTK